MSNQTKQAWLPAYQATSYIVLAPPYSFHLRIGKTNDSFRIWLKAHQIQSWCFITAYNPHSKPLSKAENESRNTLLNNQLLQMGYVFYPAEGRPDSSDWETEYSYFVLNIEFQEALALGRAFEQHALLFGKQDGLPKLVWVV